jgi:hypothetical protein
LLHVAKSVWGIDNLCKMCVCYSILIISSSPLIRASAAAADVKLIRILMYYIRNSRELQCSVYNNIIIAFDNTTIMIGNWNFFLISKFLTMQMIINKY